MIVVEAYNNGRERWGLKGSAAKTLGTRRADLYFVIVAFLVYFPNYARSYIRGHGGRSDKHISTNNVKQDIVDMDSLMDIHFSHLAPDSDHSEQRFEEEPLSEPESNMKTAYNFSRHSKGNVLACGTTDMFNARRNFHTSRVHGSGVNSESRVKLTSHNHKLIENVDRVDGQFQSDPAKHRTRREGASNSSNVFTELAYEPNTRRKRKNTLSPKRAGKEKRWGKPGGTFNFSSIKPEA